MNEKQTQFRNNMFRPTIQTQIENDFATLKTNTKSIVQNYNMLSKGKRQLKDHRLERPTEALRNNHKHILSRISGKRGKYNFVTQNRFRNEKVTRETEPNKTFKSNDKSLSYDEDSSEEGNSPHQSSKSEKDFFFKDNFNKDEFLTKLQQIFIDKKFNNADNFNINKHTTPTQQHHDRSEDNTPTRRKILNGLKSFKRFRKNNTRRPLDSSTASLRTRTMNRITLKPSDRSKSDEDYAVIYDDDKQTSTTPKVTFKTSFGDILVKQTQDKFIMQDYRKHNIEYSNYHDVPWITSSKVTTNTLILIATTPNLGDLNVTNNSIEKGKVLEFLFDILQFADGVSLREIEPATPQTTETTTIPLEPWPYQTVAHWIPLIASPAAATYQTTLEPKTSIESDEIKEVHVTRKPSKRNTPNTLQTTQTTNTLLETVPQTLRHVLVTASPAASKNRPPPKPKPSVISTKFGEVVQKLNKVYFKALKRIRIGLNKKLEGPWYHPRLV